MHFLIYYFGLNINIIISEATDPNDTPATDPIQATTTDANATPSDESNGTTRDESNKLFKGIFYIFSNIKKLKIKKN